MSILNHCRSHAELLSNEDTVRMAAMETVKVAPGKMLVSVVEEVDEISEEDAKHIQMFFGCAKCKKSFSDAKEVLQHVHKGECPATKEAKAKETPAEKKQPKQPQPSQSTGRKRGRPRKIITDETTQSKKSKRGEDDVDFTPPVHEVPSGRRATRVSTGVKKRQSILDIIGEVSARKDAKLDVPLKDEDGTPKRRRGGKPKENVAEIDPTEEPTFVLTITENGLETQPYIAPEWVDEENEAGANLEPKEEENGDAEIGENVGETYIITEDGGAFEPGEVEITEPAEGITEGHETADLQTIVLHHADNFQVHTSEIQDEQMVLQAVEMDVEQGATNDDLDVEQGATSYVESEQIRLFESPKKGAGNGEMTISLVHSNDSGSVKVEELIEESKEKLQESLIEEHEKHEAVADDQNEELLEVIGDGDDGDDDEYQPEENQEEEMEEEDEELDAEMAADIPADEEMEDDVPADEEVDADIAADGEMAVDIPADGEVEAATPSNASERDIMLGNQLARARITNMGGTQVIEIFSPTPQEKKAPAKTVPKAPAESKVRVIDIDPKSLELKLEDISEEDFKDKSIVKNSSLPRKYNPVVDTKFAMEKRHLKCRYCPQRFFLTKEELDIHHNCHIKDSKTDFQFMCTECSYETKSWNRCLEHLISHADLREKLKDMDFARNLLGCYECPVCGKKFDKKNNMKGHLVKVHKKAPKTCIYCQSVFHEVDHKTFQRHMEKCKGEVHQCPHCKYKSVVHENFRKHLKIHNGTGFTCSVCSKVFPTRSRYKTHLNTHILNRPKTICELCGQEFKTEDAAKKHIVRNHAVVTELFKCYKCNFMAKMESDLKKHIDSVHFKKFKCEHCEYNTNSEAAMEQHKNYHAPGTRYACSWANCFYTGPTPKHLTNHICQVHQPFNKHQCPVCLKCYKKKTHLARHLVVHTGDRPYVCLDCNESFASHSTYYRHRARTGHDAKREGIVSVPQNIHIQYVNQDQDIHEETAENTLQQNVISIEGIETTIEQADDVILAGEEVESDQVTYVLKIDENGQQIMMPATEEDLAALRESQEEPQLEGQVHHIVDAQVELLQDGTQLLHQLEVGDFPAQEGNIIIEEQTVTNQLEVQEENIQVHEQIQIQEQIPQAQEPVQNQGQILIQQQVQIQEPVQNQEQSQQVQERVPEQPLQHPGEIQQVESMNEVQAKLANPQSSRDAVQGEPQSDLQTDPQGHVILQETVVMDPQQEQQYVYREADGSMHTVVEVETPSDNNSQQYAILVLPEGQSAGAEPEAALSMLQLQSSMQ